MRRVYVVSAIVISIFLVGCAGMGKLMSVSSDLEAKQYNTFAAQYFGKPTFVSVASLGADNAVLLIQMTTYEINQYGSQDSYLYLLKTEASHSIELIDKFLEWEKMASKSGDIFTKDIGSTDSMGGFTLKYTFHSGNSHAHYLTISQCSIICVDETAQYYDKANALILRELLLKLKDGRLKARDIESKYH